MKDFVFSNPTKIYFGKDQLQYLGKEISKYGKKVLLVYGGGSIKKIGLYDKVIKILKKCKLQVFELSGIEPNPRHTTVNKGANICKKEKIDVVLAVGGGSTIDASKAIAIGAKYSKKDIWDIVSKKVSYKEALPLVSVLTLSATGSEMDDGSVISNMDKGLKLGFGTEFPCVSFLDPSNTFTVNEYQTACGSVDIMSHIFDVCYFNTFDKLDMLTRMQEEALKTVIKFAPIALKNPNDYEARANLMWVSSWALNGFLFDGATTIAVVHKMEHELSAIYDITHGHGLAILTPRYLRYCLDKNTAPIIKRFGVNVFGINPKLDSMNGAIKAIEALEKFFFKTLKLKPNLSDLNIDSKNFKLMAEHATSIGTLTGLKTLTKNDVVKIYKMCL